MTFKQITVIATVTSLASLYALHAIAADPNDPQKICLARMRQIGIGCMMYAAQSKGTLPATFSLLEPMINKPEVFLDPRLDTTPPADRDKMSHDQRRDWINTHCEYDFTSIAGTRLTKVRNSPTVPLAQTRDKPNTPRVTLFADGHA